MTMILNIYTDGSLIKKDNNVYCGFGIYYPNNEYINISGKLHTIDIHYAEIYAIYYSLSTIQKDLEKYQLINIYTDSQHCIKKINKWYNTYKNNEINKIKTKKGKDVKNKVLLLEIYKIIGNIMNKVKFIHVKSHSGKKDELSINNRVVDKLARIGSKLNKIEK